MDPSGEGVSHPLVHNSLNMEYSTFRYITNVHSVVWERRDDKGEGLVCNKIHNGKLGRMLYVAKEYG